MYTQQLLESLVWLKNVAVGFSGLPTLPSCVLYISLTCNRSCMEDSGGHRAVVQQHHSKYARGCAWAFLD